MTSADLAVEVLAAQLAAAERTLASYRLVLSVTLAVLHDVTRDRDAIRRRYHDALADGRRLRDEMRKGRAA